MIAQRDMDVPLRPTGISRIERLFRIVGRLDIDKADVKRYEEFVHRKIADLLLVGQAHAKANGRRVITPHDLPITKGLQECIHDFIELDEQIGLGSLLDHITPRPPLDLPIADETDARLGKIAGGLSVALVRAFKITDPELKNPRTEHWDRLFQIFDLLL
jgi:hypothetical protein